MGLFPTFQDERLVFISLGLATVSVIGMMRVILTHYRDEAEIRPKSPKTQYITQATEDALDLHTISSLLDHYNPTIRDTATKVIVGRAVNDLATIHHLLRGIIQPSYDVREKSLRALTLAMEDRDAGQSQLKALHAPEGYYALVKSLELSLDDRERNDINDPLWDEYHLRDANERRCIMLCQRMLHRFGDEQLIKAKFVERWLAKQGWGGTDEEKHTNFTNYIHRRKNRLSDICAQLLRTKEGCKALRRSKLIQGRGRGSPSDGANSGGIKVILEISMHNEDENGEIQHENFQAELVPRITDQSDEEQRRRRRHREAIVLNDGTHSLGRGDIIEREHQHDMSEI